MPADTLKYFLFAKVNILDRQSKQMFWLSVFSSIVNFDFPKISVSQTTVSPSHATLISAA
jgi:hypothetical protein